MVDPTNYRALDDLKFITGFDIEPLKGDEAAILEAIEYAYNVPEPSSSNGSEDLNQAMAAFADDFDAEDDEDGARRRRGFARRSGSGRRRASPSSAGQRRPRRSRQGRSQRRSPRALRKGIPRPPARRRHSPGADEAAASKLRDAIISRIKILARLDISEKRLPQDGRIMIRMRINGRRRQLDWRVSTLPTLWGEKIVMRLLDKDNLRLDMTQLGFEPESLEKFQTAILKPFGMVLVTGPTGSGKTNTLYSAISLLNKPDTNIMTAEDPVEFQLQGVNQVQMKEQIGLNFAAALRSFLRQDPNIILVGEIRDFETAEIAIKAALTGHLVLSTLHTNGAPETVSRLMNMGIEPFLVATSVHLIVAQRLIRRICTGCTQPVEVPSPGASQSRIHPAGGPHR